MGRRIRGRCRYYRDKLDQFLADWKKWNLDRIWTRPEDYFAESERNMVKLRRETGNALRANPHLAGYYFCAVPDSDRWRRAAEQFPRIQARRDRPADRPHLAVRGVCSPNRSTCTAARQ